MKLSNKDYWDTTYEVREELVPISLDGNYSYCDRQHFKILSQTELDGKKILEVGGGGSKWITFLAEKYPNSQFYALDYSTEGCDKLIKYIDDNNVKNIKVINKDMFHADDLYGRFDVIYSIGVVEHFDDLGAVLEVISKFLNKDGIAFNFIPNMSGVLGWLTKVFNRPVYDIHNPHDLKSFLSGHDGVNIAEAGYLCSNNFCILSSCFISKNGFSTFLYKQLSRFSRCLWWFEDNVFPLPKSKLFSPYIYSVIRK
ncbi:class I SAM-dependent methyltransferase [Vibrio sp. LaRot3]|uniref:class I SAM-dependent methyltransferase n=1 Tax=Vibrio sp. LaRot3 TaxID=2998829 RepID=UPI0022CDF0B6|nr:class I SAM-dependent methyltransferase [Vibrio sp. LaRot3]MDA0149396.1 class I SAM-dependent methyltransferase [Vibrio sp. LaRot3]